MIAIYSLLFSLLGIPGGPEPLYALPIEGHAAMIHRIELPTYYVFFILLGIVALTWGIIKIFKHQDHEH